MATALLASAAAAQSGAELSRAAEAVVALNRNGGPGAGLVVGRGPDSLLVLTAAHVLGPDGNEVRGLRARLKATAGREFTQLSLLAVDRKLDLAALRIEGLKIAGLDVCKLPVIALNAELPVRRELAVFAVGNPAGVAWAVPPAADRVSEVGDRELRFQSTVVDIGHSGGGVFNVFGDLVGLIRADQPPWGVALRVAVLTQALAGWKLEAGPGPCDAPGAAPASITGDSAFRAWIVKATSARKPAEPHAVARAHPSTMARFSEEVAALEYGLSQRASWDGVRRLSPLAWAVALGKHEVLRHLLLEGASLNEPLSQRTPGFASGETETAFSALHMAARMDDAEAVRLLAKAGADIANGYDVSEGPGSPLTVAADHNALKAAKALIAAGADTTEQRMGWSRVPFPLLAALNRGHIDMLKLLRASGARVSIRVGTTHPATLLSLAAEKAPLSSIRWLIEQKVLVDCRQPGCESPLHVAVRANRVDVIQTLIRAGANPTIGGLDPYLCVAVSMAHMPALKALLLAGADPNMAGQDGTPLAMARRDEKKEMVDALLAYGAKR